MAKQYLDKNGLTYLANKIKSMLTTHTGNKNNPHAVTADQVGAAKKADHNIATYTDLSQIGLTFGSETLESIAAAMPDGSVLEYAVDSGNTDIYPDDFGRMEVRRADADTVVFRFNTTSGWSPDEYAETYVCHARVYDGGVSVTAWVKVFDGGSMPVNIFYGEGAGDQAAASKTVTISQEGFALKQGVTIAVKFNNQNKVTAPYLNVNGTGDIAVKQNGSVDVGAMTWAASQVALFTYDGTYWMMHGAVRASVNGRVGPTTLSSAIDSTAEDMAATPNAVKTAYDLANGKAPTSHASTDTTYGKGTSSNYGHVKLSASLTSTSGASSGVAATPSAVKSLNDKFGVAYVTEQGTSGIWTYRKWSNGVNECWGTFSVSYSVPNSITTGVVAGNSGVNTTYPSGLFSARPKCQYALNRIYSGSTHYNGWLYLKGIGSASQTPSVVVGRFGSAISSCTIEIDFYAIGT